MVPPGRKEHAKRRHGPPLTRPATGSHRDLSVVGVVVLLLVFFLVGGRGDLLPGFARELPRGGGRQGDRREDALVNVSPRAAGFLNSEPVTVAMLGARIRPLLAKNRELAVIINADREVTHARVVDVLDQLRQTGVDKIAIAVAPDAALAIRPSDEESRARVALMLVNANQPGRALVHLTALADHDSKRPDVYLALARVAYDRNDFAATAAAFEKSLTLRDSGRTWFNPRCRPGAPRQSPGRPASVRAGGPARGHEGPSDKGDREDQDGRGSPLIAARPAPLKRALFPSGQPARGVVRPPRAWGA